MTQKPQKAQKPQIGVGGRAALGVLGLVQMTLAFLAFWDLAHRDAAAVKGPKPVWIPVILVNWLGPLSYFTFGIRH